MNKRSRRLSARIYSAATMIHRDRAKTGNANLCEDSLAILESCMNQNERIASRNTGNVLARMAKEKG